MGASVSLAHAAVPVEESIGQSRAQDEPVGVEVQSQQSSELNIPPTIEPTVNTDFRRPSTTPSAVPGGQGQLSELFYQIQVLQQEIQTLRGQVEEQNYLVKRLQRDQKEQYLDLDRRVVALSENRPAPGPVASTPTPPSPAASAGGLSESEAYKQAIDTMRARQFNDAQEGFLQLIENYPNGRYTPNAFYWLGELHLAKGDAELARQSFSQVINLYPDHQKVPDALYKLGVVHHNLGDQNVALDYLRRVQSTYPKSSAASLAAKYAAELQ